MSSSQHTRSPTTTSYHNHQYRSFHYPSASTASAYSHDPVSPILPSERSFPSSPPPSAPAYNDAYNLAHSSPFVSPIMSRTPSVAGSDRYSTVSGVTGYWPQNPDNVSPAAAYVAPFGAVQVVNEQRARRASDASDDEEDRNVPNKDDAQFSPQALTLINHFLDQLLYSFLSTARSTNLHALRPAVTEVLRHRLAKEAVANADEELQELLAGGEEDEERNALSQVSSRDSRKWDLELVWKRTRLRVMVYMRLGEMEDDDEERFVKEQELFYGREADSRRFSSSSGLVSWSAAIFLTSVLEYIAEQSLQAAGSVAYARTRRPSVARPETTPSEQIKVEDFDVEKLALDARLGRLWRTWRKSTRNDRQRPMTPNHRGMVSRSSFTRDRAVSLSALRRGSMGHSREESMAAEEQYRAMRQQYPHGMGGSGYDDPETDYPEHVLASNIPLPMRDAKRDVDEIEVPGLAKNSEDDTENPVQTTQARRNSFTSPKYDTFASSTQPQAEPKLAYFPLFNSRPSITRQRSKSVPNQPRTPKLEIPGAFPMMPEERDAQTTNETQETMPEPKASAVDMNYHKHSREESKVLLKDVGIMPRKVDNSEQALRENESVAEPEVEAQNVNIPEEAADEKSITEDHSGVLAGVAAGATAVAGAALAAVGLSHHNGQGEEKAQCEEPNELHEQSTESSDMALPRPRDRSSKEIRELDNGKSLVDLKTFVAADSRPRSREASTPREIQSAVPETISAVQKGPPLDPTISLPTDNSYIVSRGEFANEPESAIVTRPVNAEIAPPSPKPRIENGHSRHDTATIAALEAPASPSEISDSIRSEQKARDMPMIGSPKPMEKPGRLIIDGDSLAGPNKPSPVSVDAAQATRSSASPRSPREFLRNRDLSLNSDVPRTQSKDYAVQSPNEQTRANAPRSVTAASSPATPTSSDNRARDLKLVQSMIDQKKNGSPQSRSFNNAHHQKQNSTGEIQDHPAIHSMSTPRKDTIGAASAPAGTNTPPVVTSASIRGPEDFDNFLQGDDTVKYTLTPETVRDQRGLQSTEDSRSVKSQKSQTSHAASLSKLSGQASEGASKSSARRKDSSPVPSAQHKSRASRSQSIKDVTAVSSQTKEEPPRERRRSISKPPVRNTSSHRKSGLMAREPQVMTASTRDFADFIRSTGPDREPEVKRIHTSRSTTSLHSTHNTARSQSVGASSIQSERERTKSMTQTTMAAENIPPVPKMPTTEARMASGNRVSNLQARSATGAGNGNKDLINFIRDGPEEEGSHRISRSVAPFRNTMDSDQFGAMGDDFASSAPSKPSTEVNGVGAAHGRSTSTIPSQPTPVHRTTPSTSESTQRLVVAPEPEGDGRTRYRNKDPYAIPSDSEDEEDEEDFLTALPRKNQRPQEESLVDFLRNNEPPTNNAPRPISGAAARVNNSQYPPAEPVAPRAKTIQSQSNGPQPVSSPNFSPPNANSTPRPTTGGSGPKLEARGAGAPRKTIPRGNAGARLGAYQQTNTGDLADFLRSSGPTEESAPRRQEPAPLLPESPKKEKKKSFFSRFKKEKV